MELIKQLKTRRNDSGNYISYGVFLCPYCESKVEKQTSNGARSKSCGCAREKLLSENHTIHGEGKGNPLYWVWTGLRARCNNPKNVGYRNYGGRGITVCNEWQNYTAFKKWADANGYHSGLTIDRIDNDGDYEPGNCRWADYNTQNRNSRNTKLTMEKAQEIRRLKKETNLTQTEMARNYGVNQATISDVVNNKSWKD